MSSYPVWSRLTSGVRGCDVRREAYQSVIIRPQPGVRESWLQPCESRELEEYHVKVGNTYDSSPQPPP